MSNIVVLPFNIEAEQAVIGAMLINDEAVYYASNKLTKDDFYRKDHSIIFEAMRIMQLHSMPVDIVTVSEYNLRPLKTPKTNLPFSLYLNNSFTHSSIFLPG